MRVLGIDHGTNSLGWGLLQVTPEEGTITTKYLSHGFITRPKGLTYPSTILYMVEGLRDVLAEYTPDYVAVEAPKDNRGFRSTQVLTELLGSVKYCLMAANYPFTEIAPSTMKKIVTGYGWSSKEEVAAAVAKSLRLNFEDIVPVVLYKSGEKKGEVKEYILDGSDALGLALAFVPYVKGQGGKLDFNPGGSK